jgi:hypothetical protein
LPGFDGGYHLSLLPFWGNNCLVDFAVACFGDSTDVSITIVLDEAARAASLALSTRWKKPLARVHVLEGGLQELARLVHECAADTVVLAALTSVVTLQKGALAALMASMGPHIVKVSVTKTPIEMYFAPRERMARLLASAAEHAAGKPPLREALFDGALHNSMDLIEDVPGEILFQNDLMEYYTNNMWVVANCESERFHTIVASLPDLSDKGAESHIAEKGSIRNSWIAAGVEVEGAVEDSIIFPHVHIRRNSLVSRSVVLNGNHIGSGTEIRNALILPFSAEVQRSTSNIGDNCAIGAKTSTMKNGTYPTQIRDGLAVIGINSDIPNGFRAEAASYVAPGVSSSVLRKLKVLRKGTSILNGSGGAEAPGSDGETQS